MGKSQLRGHEVSLVGEYQQLLREMELMENLTGLNLHKRLW